MKKLTNAQASVLRAMNASRCDAFDYQSVVCHGGNGRTMKKLVELGLVSERTGTWATWAITDNGREMVRQ